MVRLGNSEKSSSQDSRFEEREHRYSEVVLSPRHTRGPGREVTEESVRCAQAEQQPGGQTTQDSPRRVTGERANDDWTESPRVSGLLPMPSGPNLSIETSVLNLGQPPLIDSQALSSEHRLLELQRESRLLSASLGAVLVGTVVFYAASVRPEIGRQGRVIAQLQQVNAEQSAQHEREREQLSSRLTELATRFGAIRFQLNASDALLLPTANPSAQEPEVLFVAAPKEAVPERAPKDARPVLVAKVAPSVPVANDVSSVPVANDVPSVPAANDVPQEPTLDQVREPAAASDSSKPLKLEDAMKAAVSKEATKANAPKETPQAPKPAEPQQPAATGCDRNDPLCGDLNS